MRKVKSYTQFILEKDGGALASDAVSNLAKIIKPDDKQKTKEEVEQDNPELAALAYGGWEWSNEYQGYIKISDVLCGKVICVPGGPYRVLTGPNKGKVGLWKGAVENVIFQPPTGISSISELEGPDEEFIRERFPGIDYYANASILVPRYATETNPFEMNYYDLWQTYGNVKITYNKTEREFEWVCIDGPNNGRKGKKFYWSGTEETAKKITIGKNKQRSSKGKSELGMGILYPWTMREERSPKLSPVTFPSVKYMTLSERDDESKEIKGTPLNPTVLEYCEDPDHFLYLTMDEGVISPPSGAMFKDLFQNLLENNYGGKIM
jgi:hypothetical protein